MANNCKTMYYTMEIDITDDQEQICALCRKKYLQDQKKQLNKKMSFIHHLSELGLDMSTPQELIRSMPADYQDVPISYFFHPSAKKWGAETYEKMPNLSTGSSFISNNGVSLRSKYHRKIANQLEKNDLLYRYYCAITLGKQKLFPTFTIKNPFDDKIFIWEHFSSDEFSCVKETNELINQYVEHDYTPYEKLIYTFDDDIDPRHLQKLIEGVVFRV